MTFQHKHALEFGLEILELEEKGNMLVVTSVHCLLCVYCRQYFGSTSHKHKPIDNIHVFKAPFIEQHYLSHLKQHAETWEEYNEISVDGKVKHTNIMHMSINTSQDAIRFIISLSIVHVIKKLFYLDNDQIFVDIDEDEEDHHMNMERIHKKAKKKIALKHNTMKFFKLNEDNEMYTVEVLNNMRLFVMIDYVKCDMLFWQTTVVIRQAKDRLKVQSLGGINNHNVGQYVRALVTTNLNKIVDLLPQPLVWVFWVIRDGSTHYSSSFFDMRICIYVDGILSNLHLVAIPMFEWHIVENIFNLIACFLDALNGVTMIWHVKLVSVSTDGENTMIGCHCGILIRFEQAAEFSMLCI